MLRKASRTTRSCFVRLHSPCARRLLKTTCIGRRVLTGRSSLRRPRRKAPPCSVRDKSARRLPEKSDRCMNRTVVEDTPRGNVYSFKQINILMNSK